MVRPYKRRRICGKPICNRFRPLDLNLTESDVVILTLDEFECIRLIDYEGLTQEQCAEQMNVARTTIQAIYKSGREKIADSIVNVKELQISGGNVVYCEEKHLCCKRYCSSDIEKIIMRGDRIEMRIAVTYENGEIFQHFGHTQQFKLYDIVDGKVAETTIVDTNGSGHGALAGFLSANKADILICGGIGGGAQTALSNAGIKLYGGVTGNADNAVEAYLSEKLEYNPNVKCNHHGEGHGHGDHHGNCGENHGSCGEHSCGNH